MEAIGLAIGVPGLAALFLKAGLQGYEALAGARNVSADMDHYIHSIKLEQQKLQDWRDSIDRVKLSDDLGSPERERYLLIVGTLARIASLFSSMADMEDEYVPAVERTEDQRVSSKTSRRRFFHRFRRSKQMVGSSAMETAQNSSSPASPRFGIHDVLPHDINSDQLKMVAEQVGKSEISIQNIKWALHDRKKLQGLLERLSGYTQNLIEISGPLTSGSGMFLMYIEYKRTTKYNSIIVSRSGISAKRQFMMPFPHNPNYVERKDIHDRLNELLAPSNDTQPRAALWALGGMG